MLVELQFSCESHTFLDPTILLPQGSVLGYENGIPALVSLLRSVESSYMGLNTPVGNSPHFQNRLNPLLPRVDGSTMIL